MARYALALVHPLTTLKRVLPGVMDSKLLEKGSLEAGHSRLRGTAHPEVSQPPAKLTLIEIIDEKKRQILLIRNAEGISRGRWNGLGGKVEEGETPLQAVKREVFEESGLKVKSFMYHGALTVFLGGAVSPSFILYVFSSREYSGRLKADGHNDLRWFSLDALPSLSMWQDDCVWLPYVLSNRRWVSGNFEFGPDNLLRVAEIVPLKEGEDFPEKVRRSIGILAE